MRSAPALQSWGFFVPRNRSSPAVRRPRLLPATTSPQETLTLFVELTMSAAAPKLPIAIFHEHTEWFKPLFAEFERRSIPYVRVNAASHVYDPSDRTVRYSLVVNRASPSAYMRGNGGATFHTLHWLKHIEGLGIPVVNGSDAYGVEISKSHQLELLEQFCSDSHSSCTHDAHGRCRRTCCCVNLRNTEKSQPPFLCRDATMRGLVESFFC